ncbi:MAG: CinA family nicotinamide mononucleotide deamidase-related protein [Trueperaceae bacterium]|nr:CinA family nicotinamide mononucleotide deamidase-related protein [Trueperaceae bacterium]
MQRVASAETISVGTELLLGEIVDTNSAYLAADLATRGVDVYRSVRVGDNHDRIVAALSEALSRCDLVVMCGGLGPTDDDLTRDAVATVVGEVQRRDESLVSWLRERFAATGRPMPERNLQQASVIDSAEVLANPIGTAPGWLVRFEWQGSPKLIVTLPGPPRELDRMWREQAIPRLPLPTSRLFVRTFKTIGVGESLVADRLGEMTLSGNPSVATYAKRDGVHVRVAAKAGDDAAAEALAAPFIERVAGVLGESVWGADEDELATLVARSLTARSLSVAVAEGASAGLLSQLLGEGSDGESASQAAATRQGALLGSVISWTPERMRTLGLAEYLPKLGVGDPLAAAYELVAAMAVAVRALFAADIGVAVGYPQLLATGSSGAPGASGSRSAALPDLVERAPTRVFIALTDKSGTDVKQLDLPPLGRAWIRERTAFSSLHLLLRSAKNN